MAICLTAFAAAPCVRATQASTMAQHASIRHVAAVIDLLEMTGVFANARVSVTGVVERLKPDYPVVPPALWETFVARVADHDAVVSLYVPIYTRHLNEQDTRAIVAFYRSALGARLLQAGPQIQTTSRAFIQSWTRDVIVDLAQASTSSSSTATLIASQSSALADLEPQQIAAIHELLHVSGTLAEAEHATRSLLDRLQQAPQAEAFPVSFWEQARGRLANEADLLQLWTPAYAQYLTADEIHGLIDFYRSPLGKRFVKAMSAINTESVAVGAQLAADAAKRAIREVLGSLPQWKLNNLSSSASLDATN